MWQRAVVIVNPSSGNRRAARIWPEVERNLRRVGLPFEAFFTTGPGDATELAVSACRAGSDLIVAVGGDGTVNEVANGMLRDGPASASLGIVACGSGCDFIRTLGLPKGVAAVESLAGGQTIEIDVGRARFQEYGGKTTDRYFVNSADLGFGAEVANRVNRSRKPLGGFLSFLASSVVVLVGAKFKTVEYSIDGVGSAMATAGMIFVANGQYAGGGMRFAPKARLDDGLFDVVLLREVGRPTLLADLLPRVYRGAHLGHPAVTHLQAREVSVSSLDPLLLEMDGEQPGSAPASFTLVPRALRIAVPAGMPPA